MSGKHSPCFSSCLCLPDICRQRSNINVFIFLLFSHLICIYLPAFLSLTNFSYSFVTLQRSGSGFTLQRSGFIFLSLFLLFFQYSVNVLGVSADICLYSGWSLLLRPGHERSWSSCFSFNIPWTDLVYRGSFLRTRREDPGWARDVNGLTLVSLFLLFFQYSVNRSGLSRVIFAYPQRRPSMSQRCERSYIGFFVLAFLSIFREQIWFIEGHFCVPAEKTLDEPEMWTVLHWLIGCIELIWIELYCIVLYFFIIPSIPRWGVTTPKLYSDHCPSSDLSYRFDLLAFLSVFIFFIRHPGTEWIL